MTTFLGFPRKHGPAGIRNHVIVISGELSCNSWAINVAACVKDCWAVTHKNGMGNSGADRSMFLRILSNMVVHPNVAGVVLIVSGNEDYDPLDLVNRAMSEGRKSHLVSARQAAHSGAVIEKGIALARQLVKQAQSERRVAVDIDQLRIGLNCAGTDKISETTSHRASAAAMNQLVEAGSTVVLTEIPEMIGLDEDFFNRSATKAIEKKLRSIIRQHKRRLLAAGEDINQTELCPFNVEGGLSSLAEKSRICVIKAGTNVINEVLAYGEIPTSRGLVVMDGPAMTDFVMTGLMGAGVHVMSNCCGAGPANLMPFVVGADTASPILPVIKVTGGQKHFRRKENRIDFNASMLLEQPEKTNKTGARLFKLILDTASGKTTRTERGQDFSLSFPMRFCQA